jgi:hypothetical protein
MNIIDEVRQILIAAKPANSNRVPCACSARPVADERINQLLATLDSIPIAGQTYERPLKRVVLHPAPYQRAMAGGRPLR